uniref:Uncharacterized protein n=1 Tax=viral metagenome TaxID=1070528 RepID=A0A6M3JTT0_9ZZZZ
MANFSELPGRRIIRTGLRRWRGTRRFKATRSGARGLEKSLYDRAFPGYSGAFAPFCTTVDTREDVDASPMPVLVTAGYETIRNPGWATVRVVMRNDYEAVKYDILGKVIEGVDQTSSNLVHSYKVVKGTNKVPVPHVTIIVETASTEFDLDAVIDRVGMLNSNVMRAFGSNVGRIGALKLLGPPDSRWYNYGGLWYINYAFAYSGPNITWFESLWSQKGFWAARPAPVVNLAGALDTTIATKYKAEFLFKSALVDSSGNVTAIQPTKAEPRYVSGWANFSDIDGIIKW